jgi:hypothetical protein
VCGGSLYAEVDGGVEEAAGLPPEPESDDEGALEPDEPELVDGVDGVEEVDEPPLLPDEL